jgi:adenine-specific DNA methylase
MYEYLGAVVEDALRNENKRLRKKIAKLEYELGIERQRLRNINAQYDARANFMASAREQRHMLQAAIAEDQRQYVEAVREWLRDSLANKGKTVGGPR